MSVQAVLLSGGFGSRLKPLTDTIPKPMLPVGGRPWLSRLVCKLRDEEITNHIITTHYLPYKIREHFGSGSHYGVKIKYVHEEEPLGTGGAIRNTLGFIDSKYVIILNTDIYSEVSYRKMLKYHKENKAGITIALTEVEDVTQFGVVGMDGNKITEFVEKPTAEKAPSNLINAGIYIFNRDVIAEMPYGEVISVEKEFFPHMIRKFDNVYGYRLKGDWLDFGTVQNYEKVNALYERELQSVPV